MLVGFRSQCGHCFLVKNFLYFCPVLGFPRLCALGPFPSQFFRPCMLVWPYSALWLAVGTRLSRCCHRSQSVPHSDPDTCL